MGYWNSSDDEAPTSYSQADLSIQKKFSECLDEVHRQHPSVVFGTRCNPVNPGLHVNGFGTLGLPLSDQDAASLTHATERLMSGDAGDLATSDCTRNIPANQIGLRNLVWNDFANAIFKDVLKEFGLDPESSHITAELARLMIQRKNSRRPSEWLTPKGTFATMVFYLPSQHEGGRWDSEQNEVIRFEPARTSEFDMSYIAWYSDVPLSVKPITSGNCLTLTYHLRATTSVAELSQGLQQFKCKSNLKSILGQWNQCTLKDSSCPKVLAHMLDKEGQHKYDGETINHSHLQGIDRTQADYLTEVCSEASCRLLLGTFVVVFRGDSRDSGDRSNEMVKIRKRKVTFGRVVDLAGVELGRDIECRNKDKYYPCSVLLKEKPDEEESSGRYLVEHIYRGTTLIVIPNKHYVNFLFQPRKITPDIIHPWMMRLKNLSQTSHVSREELTELCERTIQNYVILRPATVKIGFNQPIVDSILDVIIETAIENLNGELFGIAVVLNNTRSSLPATRLLDAAIRNVGKQLFLDGLEKALNAPEYHYQFFRTLQQRVQFIETLQKQWHPYLFDLPSPAWSEWGKSNIERGLNYADFSPDKDTKSLSHLEEFFGHDWLFEWATKWLRRLSEWRARDAALELVWEVPKTILKPDRPQDAPVAISVEWWVQFYGAIFKESLGSTGTYHGEAFINSFVQALLGVAKDYHIFAPDSFAALLSSILKAGCYHNWGLDSVRTLFNLLIAAEGITTAVGQTLLPETMVSQLIQPYLLKLSNDRSTLANSADLVTECLNAQKAGKISREAVAAPVRAFLFNARGKSESNTFTAALQKLYTAKAQGIISGDDANKWLGDFNPKMQEVLLDKSNGSTVTDILFQAAKEGTLPRKGLTTVFKSVITFYLSRIRSKDLICTTLERQKYTGNTQAQQNNASIDSDTIISWFRLYMILGLDSEADRFLSAVLEKSRLVPGSLTTAALFDMLAQILGIIQELGKGFTRPAHQRFFKDLLVLHKREKEPLLGDRDRTIKVSPCGEDCHLCEDFNKFIKDASKDALRIYEDWNVRQHIQSRLHTGLRIHVDYRTSPYYFIVTKLLPEWQRKMKLWKANQDAARRMFWRIDQGAVKQLLGAKYDELALFPAPEVPATTDDMSDDATTMRAPTTQVLGTEQRGVDAVDALRARLNSPSSSNGDANTTSLLAAVKRKGEAEVAGPDAKRRQVQEGEVEFIDLAGDDSN